MLNLLLTLLKIKGYLPNGRGLFKLKDMQTQIVNRNGIDYLVEVRDCTCSCHSNSNTLHIRACCNNGKVYVRTIRKAPSVVEQKIHKLLNDDPIYGFAYADEGHQMFSGYLDNKDFSNEFIEFLREIANNDELIKELKALKEV